MFEKIKNGTLPIKKTKYSACYDCYANETIKILPNKIAVVGLGFKISDEFISKLNNKSNKFTNKHLELYIRSSASLKGLSLANSIGIIDIDYPKEIKALVVNNNNYIVDINRGDRICQITLKEHFNISGLEIDDNNREGGLGSTN